ncbi:MAG TPA: cyclase family protein [Pyrinomonadaceae bacterium]|nr:cyclase family protein [Pyrinomonadaceae bacterium]
MNSEKDSIEQSDEVENSPFVGQFFRPVDLSIPLKFNGVQPNVFGVGPASSEPVKSGALIGDTRSGGSCNFERYTLIPHCNGTHTECIGHILNDRFAINELLEDVLVNALLISVKPEPASNVSERYSLEYQPFDKVIASKQVESALVQAGISADDKITALIIRTLPNDDVKLSARYGSDFEKGEIFPPFFTIEAMRLITSVGFRHLLCDLPSIDRLNDNGKLANHRIFWNVPSGSFDAIAESRMNSTITELIYVPNYVPDGKYLLNLQIAPFSSDCSPARPMLLSKLD